MMLKEGFKEFKKDPLLFILSYTVIIGLYSLVSIVMGGVIFGVLWLIIGDSVRYFVVPYSIGSCLIIILTPYIYHFVQSQFHKEK